MSDTRLSQGFDAGNYCNSYETQDYRAAREKHDLFESDNDAFSVGFRLGFFASYTLAEIPLDMEDVFTAAYHSQLGQRVIDLGYCDSRKEEYDESNNTRDTA
jgi:hypothetical protein